MAEIIHISGNDQVAEEILEAIAERGHAVLALDYGELVAVTTVANYCRILGMAQAHVEQLRRKAANKHPESGSVH